MKTENTVWHHQHVNKEQRAQLKNQKPCLLWYTGLSGSGKSTLGLALLRLIKSEGEIGANFILKAGSL